MKSKKHENISSHAFLLICNDTIHCLRPFFL
nr:MAG TPA: hypothetical protein [Caudoviricetes sp.]